MTNMKNAAADDIAKAIATNKTAYIAPRITPQRRKNPLTRMVDLFCEQYAAGLPTTIDDLRREGFTDSQINEHLAEATRLTRNRLNTH